MKYAVISVINGNFKIETEHGTDKQAAIVSFHDKCQAFWNAPDVLTGVVMVADENLCTVDGRIEHIQHDAPAEA